ncbi:carbohydrate ABC transporter substrate-binding protein [Budviciaceae bacterium BWR-B9]|uniref:Carbohydrate ABC transporter substrate-binding protein n=1 Tax=Limnobaculum allomyrinae TaxID=2791986 RepID=A0ABS1IPI0_9GAMM|nr:MULTISPECIES: ABC transporter substrate-binding protein [Limnobaculum]MBK5143612.1 carbohydrate ABC transporter substrate-binding protein [Limnobaculum allomyrinae]MBV7692628.1 ABC transporter substrate-binding protein [Limnobaculum sp. M2-1]
MNKKLLIAPVLLCSLVLGACESEKQENVTIEFMHSSVEQERQAVISKLIARFEQANPTIKVKQVPVEEDAYNTKVITLARTGKLPEVIEVSHDYAKVMDKELLIDRKAISEVIDQVKPENFYDGVLRIVRTEDGSGYTGIPVSGWIQGIWYHKKALEQAGFSEPQDWQQLMEVAAKFTQPAKKKYGIALPTAESVMTEQAFSQFALSNNANIFDADGKITVDTNQMRQALDYYKQLAHSTMPGSNDVMEIKDAFMNGTVPMAIYSTYILPAVYSDGDPQDLGFAVPTEKMPAVYGTITSLTISAGLESNNIEAAKRFVEFIEQSDNATDWVLMSPGAALPVTKLVTSNTTYINNPVIKAFGTLPNDLVNEFKNVQVFGSVGEKNFIRMGDITGSAVIGEMVNNVTVGKKNVDTTLTQAQQRIEAMMQQRP